jgi:hypothetical protein
LQKIIEKKASFFKDRDLKTVYKLENNMMLFNNIHIILENIEGDVIPEVIKRLEVNLNKRREIEEFLRLSVYMEYCFFTMLERNPNIKKMVKKKALIFKEKSNFICKSKAK